MHEILLSLLPSISENETLFQINAIVNFYVISP